MYDSPFKIEVGENGTTNAGHVVIEGDHTKVGVANEWNELPVDISKAGQYFVGAVYTVVRFVLFRVRLIIYDIRRTA